MGRIPPTLGDTLVGSGFLREAPQNVRALMRRCLVLPHRPVLGGPVIPISHRQRSHPSFEWTSQVPAPAGRAEAPIPSAQPPAPRAAPAGRRPAEPRALPAAGAQPWWDDPVTIGALLVVMPPMGLAALWASRHYGKEARLAISAMMGLMLSLVAAFAVALVLR
jgi:hypothetical protein